MKRIIRQLESSISKLVTAASKDLPPTPYYSKGGWSSSHTKYPLWEMQRFWRVKQKEWSLDENDATSLTHLEIFDEIYEEPPRVALGLRTLEFGVRDNLRIEVKAEEVNEVGFKPKYSWWCKDTLHRCGCQVSRAFSPRRRHPD